VCVKALLTWIGLTTPRPPIGVKGRPPLHGNRALSLSAAHSRFPRLCPVLCVCVCSRCRRGVLGVGRAKDIVYVWIEIERQIPSVCSKYMCCGFGDGVRPHLLDALEIRLARQLGADRCRSERSVMPRSAKRSSVCQRERRGVGPTSRRIRADSCNCIRTRRSRSENPCPSSTCPRDRANTS
jgi:hypothetical protein